MKRVRYTKAWERDLNTSLDRMIGDEEGETRFGDVLGETKTVIETDENLYRHFTLNKFTGVKREVVRLLMDGENFNSAGKLLKLNTAQTYKIKKELMIDLAYLKTPEHREAFVKGNREQIAKMMEYLIPTVRQMSLQQFSAIFINDYDVEAESNAWTATAFQDTLGEIWETNQKTVTLAPREHLKTTSILAWLVKTIFCRQYPLEINYYHINGEMAAEKFNKLKRIIERNPLIADNFQLNEKTTWREDKIELLDGTVIQPLSYQQKTVGKHPHIIVLDDVIDSSIIYSDVQNEKAINKFYTTIYPQIGKEDPNKKIIIIGTAQRKDDLYSSVPKDFVKNIFQAVVDEEKKQVLSPELFTYDRLMKIKEDMSFKHGEKYFLKEYMNMPFEALGLIVRPEQIKHFKLPQKSEDRDVFLQSLRIYQGWDLSVGKDVEKGDWTGGATIGVDVSGVRPKIYILDMYRARVPFATRLEAVQLEFQAWRPILIGIEDVTFQYDTIQTLQKNTILPITGIKALINKIQSFQVELAPYFENGEIYLNEDMELLELLENELLSLPVGEHDDMADAIKIAIKTSLLGALEPNIRVI